MNALSLLTKGISFGGQAIATKGKIVRFVSLIPCGESRGKYLLITRVTQQIITARIKKRTTNTYIKNFTSISRLQNYNLILGEKVYVAIASIHQLRETYILVTRKTQYSILVKAKTLTLNKRIKNYTITNKIQNYNILASEKLKTVIASTYQSNIM